MFESTEVPEASQVGHWKDGFVALESRYEGWYGMEPEAVSKCRSMYCSVGIHVVRHIQSFPIVTV